MLVAVLGNSVTDYDARIADRAGDGQHFETTLRKIAEIIEVVHFVLNKKESVLGVVGGRGRTDDHARSVRAVTGNAVCRAGVATKRS